MNKSASSARVVALHPKRRSSCYVVYLENNVEIEVHRDLLLKYYVRKGSLLSLDEQQLLVEGTQRTLTREKAFELLARRPHSVQELRRKLRQRGFPSHHIEPLLKELEEKGYLNDRAFVRTFIQSRIQSRNWGPYRLQAELRKRGIAPTLIEEELKHMVAEEQVLARARELARKFIARPRIQAESPSHRKQKLFNFLLRKGYPYDLCRQVAEELENAS